MTQPTLGECFSGGPPTRDEKTRNTWMTSEERRFILWDFKEGWSAARIGREPAVAKQVAGTLRRPLERIQPAMHLSEGFPIDDLVVNVGLALWSA